MAGHGKSIVFPDFKLEQSLTVAADITGPAGTLWSPARAASGIYAALILDA
jgi:hypothetical protein